MREDLCITSCCQRGRFLVDSFFCFDKLDAGTYTLKKNIQASSQHTFLRFCLLILLILVAAGASSCVNRETDLEPIEEYFRPPTQITVRLTNTAVISIEDDVVAEEIQQTTPTPECTDDLLFIQDITIPDGTEVKPGDALDKRWEVRNNGNCNWDKQYSIRLIAGPGMNGQVTQALIPARSGTDVIIRMILTAPDEPGYYRSVWQAHDRHGNPFGSSFFIDIIVVGYEADQTG